jgi:hypothetical protein
VYDIHLDAKDFRDSCCRKAFLAIEAATTRHDPDKIDTVVVEEASGGAVDAVALSDVISEACIDAVLEHYAEKVRSISLAYRVRLKAEALSRSSAEGDDLLVEAMTAFNNLGSVRDDRSVSLETSQKQVWAEFEAAKRGEKVGLKTGHKIFDDYALVERGGLRARRLSRNVWKLSQVEGAGDEDGRDGGFGSGMGSGFRRRL